MFIGLRIFMSVVNLPSLKMHWAKDFAFCNFFPANVMARNRFNKLSQYFHVNDREAMELDANGRPRDRLFLIRPILEKVKAACKENHVPDGDVTVDKAMMAFRGRHGLKQYMPNKPTKYGIKVWQLNVTKKSYCSNFSLYLGKPTGGEREKNLGKKVVLEMSKDLVGKQNHAYFDNFFYQYRAARRAVGKRAIQLWNPFEQKRTPRQAAPKDEEQQK